MSRGARLAALAAAVLLALAAARAPAARAQPQDDAGRVSITAGPVVVHAAPSHERLARDLAERGRTQLARVSATLALDPPPRLDVYLLPRQGGTSPEEWGLPPGPAWAAGLALRDRPVVTLRTGEDSGPGGNVVATVLTHEIVHAVVAHGLGPRTGALPAWFSEGLASHLAYEWRLLHGMHAAGLAVTGHYVPLSRLDAGFHGHGAEVDIAYLQAFAFVNWLAEREGDAALARVLADVRDGRSFAEAFVRAFGTSPQELEEDWKSRFLLRYRWIPVIASSSPLWLLAVGFVLVGGWRKRRAAARKLRAWEDEEALLEDVEGIDADPDAGAGGRGGDDGGEDEDPRARDGRA